MKYVSFVSAVLVVAGCSSSRPNAENTPDQVVSRIDDVSSRPSWLKESVPFQVKDGQVTSLGSTQIPGDHRVEAAYRIASNNAKAAISNAIESRLEFILQSAEEGTGDSTQARFIGAEASKLVSSSIRPGARY